MAGESQGQEIGEAFVRIRPKADGFEGDAKRQIEDPLQRIAKGAAAAFAAIAVGGFLRGGIAELGEAQKAAAQTTAALKSTGGQANVTAEDIDTLTEALADLSGADKEVVQSGANLLLTFRNVRNEIGDGNDVYNQALTLAQDLSVAFGQDLQSSVIQLGKALDNPIAGVTALQRVGVTLSAQQKDQIRSFVESGQVLEAQKVILGELTKQVGGSAEAFGTTLPGKIQRAQNAFDDLKGEIVAGAAPALEGLLDVVRPAVDVFSAIPAPVQTGAIALGALALAAPKAIEGFSALSGIVGGAREAFDTLALKAMYAGETVGGVASQAASAVTALGPVGLAGGLGVAAVATIVFADAQSRAAERQREVTAGAKEYQQAIEDQTGALQDNLNAVTARKLGEGTFARVLEGTEANYRALSQGIADNADELDRWRGYLESGSSGFRVLNRELEDAAGNGDEFAAELRRLQGELSDGDFRDLVYELELVSTQYANGTRDSAAYKAALEGLGVSSEGAADAAENLATSTDSAKAAFEREQKAAQDARDALDELLRATDDLFGAQLSLQDAEIATRRALDAYVQAQRDGTKSADDRAAAGIDLLQAMQREAEAASDAAVKQGELEGKTLSAAEQAAIQKQKLEELAGTLAPTSPLRQQLQGFIDQLQAVIERSNIEIQVQQIAPGAVSMPAGMSPQDYLLYILGESGLLVQGMDGGLYRKDTGERVRATGGPAMAGTTYEVAEPGYGPEMYTEGGRTYLIPGQGGMVTNARDTAAALGGNTTWAPVLNITTIDPDRAARQALRLMRREAAYAGGR